MQVFDWDRFSKNDPMGEVKLQLGYFDLTRAITEWRQLQAYSGKVRLIIFTVPIITPVITIYHIAVSRRPEQCEHREVQLLPA